MNNNNETSKETHPEALNIADVMQRFIGKQFKHKNGNIYTVLFLTNTESTPERLKQHPIDVVYMGQNGKLWSRRLSDWDRSFVNVA